MTSLALSELTKKWALFGGRHPKENATKIWTVHKAGVDGGRVARCHRYGRYIFCKKIGMVYII